MFKRSQLDLLHSGNLIRRWQRKKKVPKSSFDTRIILIPKEDKEKIFDRYFQCNGATKSKGTGLGLSIVKKVIEIVNGKIEVESEVGKGTTFIVYIPCE